MFFTFIEFTFSKWYFHACCITKTCFFCLVILPDHYPYRFHLMYKMHYDSDLPSTKIVSFSRFFSLTVSWLIYHKFYWKLNSLLEYFWEIILKLQTMNVQHHRMLSFAFQSLVIICFYCKISSIINRLRTIF